MIGMTLEVEEINSGTIFHLGGRVVHENDSQTFQQQLMTELEKGKKWVVVEASQVESMSSTGLGILIAAHRYVTEKNGTLKIAQPSKKVRSILEITRLSTIFDVFDSTEEALKASKGES